jgi:hypothetical protein
MLIIPLLFEFAMQFRRGQVRWSQLVVFGGMSILGTAFWVYLYVISGDTNVVARGFALWRVTGLPGQNIVMAIQMLFTDSLVAVVSNVIDLAFVFLFLVLIGTGIRSLPHVWTIYSVAVMFPALMGIQTLVPQVPLTSISRYGLAAFPIFVTLGMTRWRWRALPLVASSLVQILFVASFARWGWVA